MGRHAKPKVPEPGVSYDVYAEDNEHVGAFGLMSDASMFAWARSQNGGRHSIWRTTRVKKEKLMLET